MSQGFYKIISKNLSLVLLILGVVLGFLLGVFLNENVQESKEFRPKELAMLISFPGELFLRMLFLAVLPFIASSIITSLTLLDKITARKLGKRAAIYLLVNSLIATSLAVILGKVMIRPQSAHELDDDNAKTKLSAVHAILDMLR